MKQSPLVVYTPLHYYDGHITSEEHLVCQELPLEIRVNTIPYTLLMRTPGLDIELALGFCFTDRLIQSLEEVSDIRCEMTPDNTTITTVNLRVLKLRDGDIYRRSVLKSSSAAMHNPQMLHEILKRPPPLKTDVNGIRFDVAVLSALPEKLNASQVLRAQCKSSHGAALFNRAGELVYCAEDLGRHNALDKLAGVMLLRQIDPHDKILALSSRASFEMIQKTTRLGIPVVVTISAPTDLALRLADHLHCTYVQTLKNGGFAIYTHPWRFGLET